MLMIGDSYSGFSSMTLPALANDNVMRGIDNRPGQAGGVLKRAAPPNWTLRNNDLRV